MRSLPGSGQGPGVPVEPLRNESATGRCPVCQTCFIPAPNKVYCGDACKATAWRRRHQATVRPIALPAARPRRTFTVYECPACGIRAVGEQRCECGSFMRRVGWGGHCPHCDEAVAVTDLLDEEVIAPAMR